MNMESHLLEDGEDTSNVTGEIAAAASQAAGEGDSEESDSEEGREDRLAAVSNGRWMFPASCGLLSDIDTSITACAKLVKFAVAGNTQATYM